MPPERKAFDVPRKINTRGYVGVKSMSIPPYHHAQQEYAQDAKVCRGVSQQNKNSSPQYVEDSQYVEDTELLCCDVVYIAVKTTVFCCCKGYF